MTNPPDDALGELTRGLAVLEQRLLAYSTLKKLHAPNSYQLVLLREGGWATDYAPTLVDLVRQLGKATP